MVGWSEKRKTVSTCRYGAYSQYSVCVQSTRSLSSVQCVHTLRAYGVCVQRVRTFFGVGGVVTSDLELTGSKASSRELGQGEGSPGNDGRLRWRRVRIQCKRSGRGVLGLRGD